MKRLSLLFAIACATCVSALAQYMPMQKGTVLVYESKNLSENTSETYSSTVTDVTTDDKGVIKVELLDKHNNPDSPFANLDSRNWFTFNPSDSLTVNTVMTSEQFKELMLASMREMFAQMGQFPTAQQFAEVERMVKPKGELKIPLPANVTEGQNFSNSSIRANIMGNATGMKINKGTYLGYEDIEVPAGTFHCLKLTFNLSEIGEGSDIRQTMWFAKCVGVVKQTLADKKGSPISEDVLQDIKQP